MPKIFSKFIFVLALALALPLSVSAATLYLEPSSGNLIRGCQQTINIRMSTAGQQSNGAQVYLDYTSLGGGSLSISGAGLFSSYGTPPGMPAGMAGLFGYGGVVSGDGLLLGAVQVASQQLGALTLTIRRGADTLTSKVAAYPSSENILSGVTSGSYNVVSGYCETAPPYLISYDPEPGKPNHPVANDIKFDLRDDGSGVDIDSLVVSVEQAGVSVPIDVSKTLKDADGKWYSVVINPVNNLIPETKVTVTVTASDKAGNVLNRPYSFNELTCSDLGCQAGGATAQCKDGIDNDGDGKVDFPADTGCASADDNNEFQNSDYACEPRLIYSTTTVYEQCTTEGGVTIVTQCSDGFDNDGDGMIDSADSGCADSTDNNEYVVGEILCPLCPTLPTTTPIIGPPAILDVGDLRFFLGRRSVEIRPNQYGLVEAMSGFSFTAALDVASLSDRLISADLILGGKTYPMFFDNGLKLYVADVADLPSSGRVFGTIRAVHGEQQTEEISFTMEVLPIGQVSARTAEGLRPLAGATVALEQLGANGRYSGVSSFLTDNGGTYGFIVPNGTYRLKVEAEGYRGQTTAGFRVDNNIINRAFALTTVVDLFASDISLNQKADYVSEVAREEAGKLIDQASNPVVEKAAEKTVAPIALGSAVVATIPALSLLNLLSYLRFLFLQPVFLFGRKRRQKWGVVYNSLTKLPVDLAVVRLIDARTNRVVQSRVTDAGGRYAFFAEPGLYRLEVTKTGFIFPTKILQDYKEDTSFLDIYHGEAVHVDDKYTALTPNIPLDPAGAVEKTPRRLIWERHLRDAQQFVASLSIVAGLIALAISPSWWTGGFFVFQILLYYLFKRLGAAKKPKSWGIVYDRGDKRPIERAVARLFSKQFNKLVSTEVTDSNGRYSFMVGPNDYFVTFEKLGYRKATSQDIKVKEKNEVIKVNAALDREGGAPIAPPAVRPPSQLPPRQPLA